MRALIRPTLFLIARLGLFLAVMAWIVGHWQNVEFYVPELGSGVFVQLDSTAWFVTGITRFPRMYRVEIKPPQRIPDDKFFGKVMHMTMGSRGHEVLVQSHNSWQSAGVGYALSPFSEERFSIRHWLVVTIFALFSGLLMFIYRKRAKVVPCEV